MIVRCFDSELDDNDEIGKVARELIFPMLHDPILRGRCRHQTSWNPAQYIP